MHVDVKFDVLCMYTVTANGPTLTTQVITSTRTTAGGIRTTSCMSTCPVDGPTLTTQVMTTALTTAGSTRTPSSDTSSSTPRVTPRSTPEQHGM